jgi:hypothetical protein
MASRSQVIVAAAEVVLSRRFRDDDAMQAEILRRFEREDAATRAQAEFMLAALVFMAEEEGRETVARVRDRHAMAGSWR